jgi:imidazolonepropionase-like amidohydrolase
VGELARKAELPLLVHATELRNAKQALRAGAAMLVHSVEDQLVDEECIELAREANVAYAPTLQVGGNWARARSSVDLGIAVTPDDPNGCIDAETKKVIGDAPRLQELAHETPPGPEVVFERMESVGRERAIMLRNLKTLYDAGIWVLAATDAGNPLTFHGPAIYRELELMESAGIAPADLISIATRNGAAFMGLREQTGTLEVGKLADLVVLSEDPGEAIEAYRSVNRVMHLGTLMSVQTLAGK